MPPTDDPLATALAASRERFDGAAYAQDLPKWAATIKETGGGTEYDRMAQSLVDVPRLLKAVEAALDHHNREMAMNPATRILAAECARCCQPWPCREVRAITRELTGGTDE